MLNCGVEANSSGKYDIQVSSELGIGTGKDLQEVPGLIQNF
jgi:hypothetical protein